MMHPDFHTGFDLSSKSMQEEDGEDLFFFPYFWKITKRIPWGSRASDVNEYRMGGCCKTMDQMKEEMEQAEQFIIKQFSEPPVEIPE